MLRPDEFQEQTLQQNRKLAQKHPFSDFGVADPDRENYF
jgi:hypothetical protein